MTLPACDPYLGNFGKHVFQFITQKADEFSFAPPPDATPGPWPLRWGGTCNIRHFHGRADRAFGQAYVGRLIHTEAEPCSLDDHTGVELRSPDERPCGAFRWSGPWSLPLLRRAPLPLRGQTARDAPGFAPSRVTAVACPRLHARVLDTLPFRSLPPTQQNRLRVVWGRDVASDQQESGNNGGGHGFRLSWSTSSLGISSL